MGLRIESLKLFNFRNYEQFSLEDIGGLTILIGPNAVGKTNILEAVHLVTSTSSFRKPRIGQLVRQGQDAARVEAMMAGDGRSLQTVLLLEPGKKRFEVNGKPKSAADVKGTLPAVSFVPDDLDLAKKSSSVKRDALDALGTQLSKSYHIVFQDYEKSLRYKNRLLKEEAPQTLVDAMNDTFLTCAAQLYCYRHSLYKRMIPLVENKYLSISQTGEPFGASYVSSWDFLNNGERDPGLPGLDGGLAVERAVVREKLEAALLRFAGEERSRHRSLVGPHNDKISFYLNGQDASDFASQGQQRSIVLAWKLAEVEFVNQTTKSKPVLLLDDVMSELDTTRRNLLIQSVSQDVQTFITATDLSPFNETLLSRARIVQLG